MKNNMIIVVSLFLLSTMQVNAQKQNQDATPKKIALDYGPIDPGPLTSKNMKKFRHYGLGEFIHWGLYAIPGNQWKGVNARKGAPASEWIRYWSGPTKPDNWKSIYDNLYKQFNPKEFDAKAWAKRAKDMGVKYVIFTTKHHDGFALWPTKYSDYNISNTPYKKDIVKQVVDAYTAEDIDVFLYFSVMEWNNPNYMSKVPETKQEKKKYHKFLEYTRYQLLELLDNYPEIKGLWFDGTWDKSWVSSYKFAYNLEKELRKKHPGLIIGSRFRADENGNRHFDTNGDLLGDYEQGWERKFPKDFDSLRGNDWDAIMTIPPNGWGYMKDWSGLYTKNAYDLIHMLMKTNAMSGNFVINFGPDENGNFKDEEIKLMNQMSDWMDINSEAVYDTEHADIPESKYGYFTQKDNTLYFTVFNRPINNILRIALPKKATKIPNSASLLINDQPLKIKHSKIGLDLDKNTYYDIYIPEDFQVSKPFVIKIERQKGSIEDNNLMDAKQ